MSPRFSSRRDFLKSSLAVPVALAVGSSLLGQTNSNPVIASSPSNVKLPLRRYGRTGLNISALVGASDWSPDVIPMAVEAGVNYWHKAQRWNSQNFPDALKSQPREAYYLEVVVDRVGGDNKHGHIDEEAHYQFVKHCLEASGVKYYDVFKFHFGYHSLDEAKNNPGIVKAFERLKKEGLVKHLCLSQHHYNDIGGNMAYEILPYVIENLPFEAAQFFHTYGDKPEITQLISYAKQKDFGTIAMKTMGGVGRAMTDSKIQALLAQPQYGGSTPASAMVKWLVNNPDLTAAVIATKNFDQLQENLKAATSGAVTFNDREMLKLLASYNKGTTCLLCSDCVTHCPEHIAIADIMRYERYALDYREVSRAQEEYRSLTKNGTACIACGDCLPACDSGIDIIAKMNDIHTLLG